MTHNLPDLGYAYDALEPHIDARTMEIHHSKHHQAYTDKFNAALEDFDEEYAELTVMSAEELMKNLDKLPDTIMTAVRNNGGGYVNHTFFWSILKKDVQIGGEIADAINQKFGSFDEFKKQFSNAAATRFGSGWAWLVLNNGGLEIMSTANQDSPLTEGKTPLLALDVWEHAYYLKYTNKRPEYIEAFFNVINWEKVNDLYKQAKG